jgi:hypothetical protein
MEKGGKKKKIIGKIFALETLVREKERVECVLL